MIDEILARLPEYPFLLKKVETVAEDRKLSLRDALIFLLEKV